MGRRSVRKGKVWERECAGLLEDATGLPFRRVLVESREGNVGDVDAPGSPLVVQARVGARPSPYRALRDAVEAAEGTDRLPVGLVKRNASGGQPPDLLAVLPLDGFLGLLAELREAGGWTPDAPTDHRTPRTHRTPRRGERP